MPRIKHRTAVPQYETYPEYRQILREDFLFRCCYCGLTESRYGGSRHFWIDHFRPKSNPDFKHLAANFYNLLYACDTCNSLKGRTWPTGSEIAAGKRFWNPREDSSVSHFRLHTADGSVEALTVCAEYTIKRLRLNRKFTRTMRTKRLEGQARFRDALRTVRRTEILLANEQDQNYRRELSSIVASVRLNLATIRSELLTARLDS